MNGTVYLTSAVITGYLPFLVIEPECGRSGLKTTNGRRTTSDHAYVRLSDLSVLRSLFSLDRGGHGPIFPGKKSRAVKRRWGV